MATTVDNYKIVVDTNQASSSLLSLKSSLAGLAAAFSIRQVVQFSDSLTSVRNRLRLLQPSAEGVERSFQGIAAIAIAARTPLEQTADLYFRIARTADALGISQREAATITESVAKALTASGMSAQEAAGPLLQLGQALQSGTFQGDELRSILEGLPPVAKALANSLGVPIGALKTLGSQGKISGQDFVRAMRLARDSIEKDFARTLPTIGQAFTNLKTQIGLLFVEFDNQTGASQGLATVIVGLTRSIKELGTNIAPIAKFFKENADGLMTLARAVGYAFIAYVAFAKVLPGVARLQNALITAISGGGVVFTFLKNQLIGIVAGLKHFGENLLRAFGLMRTGLPFLGSLTAAFGALGKVLVRFLGWVGILYSLAEVIDFLFRKMGIGISIIDSFGKAWDYLKEKLGFSKESTDSIDNLTNGLKDQKDQFDDTAGSAETYSAKLDEAKKKINEFLGDLSSGYAQANAEIENALRLQAEVLNLSEKESAVRTALAKAQEEYFKRKDELSKKIAEIEAYGSPEEKAQLEQLKLAFKGLSAEYEAHTKTVKTLTEALADDTRARQLHLYSIQEEIRNSAELKKLQDDIAKLTMTEIEQKYYDIEAAAKASAKAAIEAEEARRNEKMPVEEQQKYYDTAIQKTKKLRDAQEELYDKSRKFSTGMKNAFLAYREAATDAAKRAEAVFTTATRNMEEAIVNFAKTGKFEWKSFVSSIVEELLRQQVRELIAKTFGGLASPASGGGGGGGGLWDTIGGLLGFANGGIIPTNGPVIVGERGPELLMGARGSQVVPNNQLSSGTTVVYNINAVDAMSFKQMVARDPSFIYAVSQQGAKSIPSTRR
jgi:lambda family phage tail tape measure protein